MMRQACPAFFRFLSGAAAGPPQIERDGEGRAGGVRLPGGAQSLPQALDRRQHHFFRARRNPDGHGIGRHGDLLADGDLFRERHCVADPEARFVRRYGDGSGGASWRRQEKRCGQYGDEQSAEHRDFLQ
jgi:hypothetical protein